MRAGRYEDELEFWVEVRVRMPLKGDKVGARKKRVASSVEYIRYLNPWKLTREAMPRFQYLKFQLKTFPETKDVPAKRSLLSTSLTCL